MRRRVLMMAAVMLGLLLAGCGGGSLAPSPLPTDGGDPGGELPPPPPPPPPLVDATVPQLLAALPAPVVDFTLYGPVGTQFLGSGGRPDALVERDAHPATWLPYWTALTTTPQGTTTAGTYTAATAVSGVPTSLTVTPLSGEADYSHAVTLTVNGAEALHGQLGRNRARLQLPGAAVVTVTRDEAGTGAVTELQSACLHLAQHITWNAEGEATQADCRLDTLDGDTPRRLRTMRYDAAANATPELLPNVRYAAWVYDPTYGDPASDDLYLRILVFPDATGRLRAYDPLSHTWTERTIGAIY